MCGYSCSRTWAHTWLLVQADSEVPVCAPRGHARSLRCAPARPGTWCVSAGTGLLEDTGRPPCSRQVSSQAAADEVRRVPARPPRLCTPTLSQQRAGWQRQDNMPWGAKPLGSPLKCLMRSDTYHLKSPACPRSRTATSLLLISLRSLCWLLNNKHRRGRCD